MATNLESPKKVSSITERVWQSVYGNSSSSSSGGNHQRRCSYESDDDEYDDYDGLGTVQLMQMGAERTKNVLILMSDTGGGHRASAEAIRDAFSIEFGDEYRVQFPLFSNSFSYLWHLGTNIIACKIKFHYFGLIASKVLKFV